MLHRCPLPCLGAALLQDVVTCVRHNCTIDDAGFRRERHVGRHLEPPDEMARLFSRYPEALARTVEIAGRCRFSLDELAYQYPEERTMPGLTPQQARLEDDISFVAAVFVRGIHAIAPSPSHDVFQFASIERWDDPPRHEGLEYLTIRVLKEAP